MKKNEELNAFFGRDMDNNESASPIVVLYNNIIQNFSNSRPEFRELHEEAIKKNLIKDNIRLL
ncbi:MAG: hypothetical protein GY754_46460, partial [bacterium]|nr:hypothetical protein [bacterium]